MRAQVVGLLILLVLLVSAGFWLYSLAEGGQKPVAVADEVAKEEGVDAPAPVSALLPELPVPVNIQKDSSSSESVSESVPSVKSEADSVPSDEHAAEFRFLMATNPPPGMVVPLWRNEINYIMDALVSRPEPPAGFAGVLIDIYMNPQQDVVVRDYALQHLDPIFDSAVSDREQIQEILYSALEETQTSMPGTALLALNRLSRRYPEVDSAKVGNSALIVAGDEDYGVMGRITALQVCAAQDVTEVVPTAQKILRKPGNPLLRRSAQSALEQIGRTHPELASTIGPLPKQENCDDCL